MGERIVLGLGDNTDFEVAWDSTLLERLIAELGIGAQELRTDLPIRSLRDLVISILGFCSEGRGGERYVESPAIIEQFASRCRTKITIGGTSVRAAIAMRKLGYRSALHLVTMNDHVRRLIPSDCPWVSSSESDSSYPHLIVQFAAGARVRLGDIEIRASRPNRIIYVNDLDNTEMRLNPAFAALAASARVFLVSGFNAMHDRALLAERLAVLRGIMRALPDDAIVYYEDACFHRPELSLDVNRSLAGAVDIHGLNEDEWQAYIGRTIPLLEPRDVLLALEDLGRVLPVPVLVVHTRHWALAYGHDAGRCTSALKGGITMATCRFRFGDDFTAADYRETERLAPEAESIRFARGLEALAGGRVCCLPSVHVDASDVTTIGLGDAFVGGFLPALIEQDVQDRQGEN